MVFFVKIIFPCFLSRDSDIVHIYLDYVVQLPLDYKELAFS